MNILFICLGNICRSPIAEEIFRQCVERAGRSDEFPRIDSAGMIDYHEGELADVRMRRHAEAHGYRLTHRSRPMKAEDFETFDRVVAMDADNLRRLRALCPDEALMNKVVLLSDFLTAHPGQHSIPDPYYGESDAFEYVIELCEDACAELLRQL